MMVFTLHDFVGVFMAGLIVGAGSIFSLWLYVDFKRRERQRRRG